MADKRLIYNENGTNAEIPNSGSNKAAYFDEASNTLVVQGLIINRVTSSISNSNGILGTDGSGKLTIIPTASATNGQYLQSNGTNWAFRDASGQATGNYLSNSDLSGTLVAPTVLSIQNVVSGVLSASNGGTGVSTFTSGGILVKDSGSAIKFIRPDAGASVLRPDGSGSWYSGGSTGTASYNVQAQRYEASPAPYTWTKPSTHKNVKIILMAGGGGGAGGRLAAAVGYPSGGGAGGFSVYDIIETGSLTASVSVGTGGQGGLRSTVPGSNGAVGSQGGDTIFSSSTGYYFIAGGGGGGSQTPSWGTPGYGNISSGFNSQPLLPAAQDSYWIGGVGSGGGGRGNDGSTVTPTDVGGSGNSYRLLGPLTASGGITGGDGAPGTNGSAVSVAYGIPGYYAAFGGGGGGGGRNPGAPNQPAGNGGNGISGSGGGGGGPAPGAAPLGTAAAGNGGNGGDGYAIIISW